LLLRSLFFLILAYFLYHIIRGLLAAPKRASKDLGASEDMVLDPQCQSYLPKNEALVRGGKYFCSENCARAFLSH
jgi:Prokaryotic metallothionein